MCAGHTHPGHSTAASIAPAFMWRLAADTSPARIWTGNTSLRQRDHGMLLRACNETQGMKEKRDIVENWLPRYTGTPLAEFGEYVLLTNFDNYVEWFAALHGGLVKGIDRPLPTGPA